MKFLPLPVLLLLLPLPTGLAAAELPQAYPWQVTLRNYLKTIQTKDLQIENHTFEFPESYANADDERVYRDWIILGHLGREPGRVALYADPAEFTLTRVEGEQIGTHLGTAGVAWWAQFDFPGNPYSGSPAVLRRALVMAIVDMLMLETSHEDPRNLKADFMGANLGTWAYTFHHGHQLLPPEAQQAYRIGMEHFLLQMERIAPRDENTNMDMRILATLAELDHVYAGDEQMHRRLVADARRILFGDEHRGPDTSDGRRGTFHPAGYIGEADGPETSYNGISLFHLAEAAMITHGDPDWDAFLPEVIRRMARFKALNTFPEPNGTYDGPSSWSKRTNDPYTRDQRDRPWRPFAEAMITDEALFRLRVDPATYDGAAYGFASRNTMLADISKSLQRLNRPPKLTRKEQAAAKPPVWVEDHWPPDLPYTWDHYIPGSYARFAGAIEAKSEMLSPPFERSKDFNTNLDGEFWTVKRGDWGFQVEAVPRMGRDYDFNGSGALAGGSLATFWTKPTGVALLGRLPNKWNYVTWDKIDEWTTHHVWGRTAAGQAFSSARQRNPWVRFETNSELPAVHVFGGLGMNGTTEAPQIIDTGYVYYRRTFSLADEGLRIKSEMLSNETDQVSQLWETIPIMANNGTQVEFQIDGAWQPAATELVENVQRVRVRRFEGSVLIEFTQPQRVRLSDVIQTEYQKKDQLFTLNVDLLRSGGKVAQMPRKSEVSYLVRAE